MMKQSLIWASPQSRRSNSGYELPRDLSKAQKNRTYLAHLIDSWTLIARASTILRGAVEGGCVLFVVGNKVTTVQAANMNFFASYLAIAIVTGMQICEFLCSRIYRLIPVGWSFMSVRPCAETH